MEKLNLNKKQLIERINLVDNSMAFRSFITKKELEKIYRNL